MRRSERIRRLESENRTLTLTMGLYQEDLRKAQAVADVARRAHACQFCSQCGQTCGHRDEMDAALNPE